MDTATLATSVIGVLTPLVVKGAREIATVAGEKVGEKASEMLSSLKRRWAGDEEASSTLERFEKNPTRYEPVLEDILHEKLDADEGLRDEMARLVDEIGPNLVVVQRLGSVSGEATGVDAGELNRGNVEVDQQADNVSGKITGARIDRIG